MSNEETGQAFVRQRWVIPVLAVLFIGPLLAAWIFYFVGDGWRPGGQVNHGALVDPGVSLPALESLPDSQLGTPLFRATWTLVVASDAPCLAVCLDALDKTRRVRLALREKAPRVRRALLYQPLPVDSSGLAEQSPGVALIPLMDEPGRTLQSTFSAAAAADSGSVYVVDPLGNVVMVFAPDFEMRGMLEDLKRLLRLSRIG